MSIVRTTISFSTRPFTTSCGVMSRRSRKCPAASLGVSSSIIDWNRNARSEVMTRSSSSRGASVVGVSPEATTKSTSVSSSLALAVSAGPMSSATRSAMNPIFSALGLSSATPATTLRAMGRATVNSTASTSPAMTARKMRKRRTLPWPPRRSSG